MLDDERFLHWLSSVVNFKPNCLRKLLSNNQPNKRNSKSSLSCFQEIYNFWLENSTTSTDSTNNKKRISKKTFLQQCKNIVDEKLLKKFNNARDSPVSLTTFFTYKPFYCVLPSEKEKQSCVCINCQNPHLLLQAINYYRSSKKLQPHESPTVYIQKLKSG